MIVKDEAHTINTTLASVLNVVDAWYILDTGSKDGTQATIRAFAKENGYTDKLHLFEEPFVE